MEQTVHLGRNGWSEEETQMLWKEIREAADSGAPLRGVFERMGQTLGRKPNSVRNYYYMQLRSQAGDEVKRAAPFETFTQEEIHDLLRQVLMARGQGQSVRACVMALSKGDKARMLRYQNKYRAILRKKPEWIEQVCEELRNENLPCPGKNPALEKENAPQSALPFPDDPDAQAALRSILSLAQRAQKNGVREGDRLRVQRDLLLMQIEDLQLAARALIRDCKDFLGCSPQDQEQALPLFLETLSGHIAHLERISG